MRNVYICTDHDGHYPVGVCTIVVAGNLLEAYTLLKETLESQGLYDPNRNVNLHLINTTYSHAKTYLDGNY